MKSYSMVAAAVLLAAHWWSAPCCAAQQPAAESRTGQNPAANPGQTQAASKIANTAGTQAAAAPASSSPAQPAFYILAEFTQSLNAKKLKPGDEIKAEVTQDVLAHGKIIIPVESKLVGHVTEVKSHRSDDPESRLGIVFDKVLLRHHMEVDFRGVLHALSAPAMRRSRVDEPDQMLSPALMGVGSSSSGPVPMSSGTTMGRTSAGVPGGMASGSMPSMATNPAGSPPSFNGPPVSSVPTTSAGNEAGGVPNHIPSTPAASGENKPMSVGMPLGVFGLKGLSLTSEATAATPGPVIVSRGGDVKLESGTQVLLKITGAAVRQP